MASPSLFNVEVVPLLQSDLVVSAAIVVVLHLDLHFFVEKISLFVVLDAEVANGLLDFAVSTFVPVIQLGFVEFVDALLD